MNVVVGCLIGAVMGGIVGYLCDRFDERRHGEVDSESPAFERELRRMMRETADAMDWTKVKWG